MTDGHTIVIDIGKTNAKASLWGSRGEQVDRRGRANRPGPEADYRALDVAGIDEFVRGSLAEFARMGNVGRVITVGHGAGAVLLRNGQTFAPPMDYEQAIDATELETYTSQRDEFVETGSPMLPLGLNLGIQLHRIESLLGPIPDDVTIVPWAQYWAWRLSGVAASEVSSLGCHTDLWRPVQNEFSRLAERRGWAARMAPIRRADESLGTITPAIAAETGLPLDCEVYCGLHDSNAALLAARGHREIAEHDATVLSTGTWFVAMRSLAAGTKLDIASLEEARDCLVNVDVYGNAVPSARFMGGRESELIGGVDSFSITENYDPDAIIDRLPRIIADGSCALPSFVRGVGPFPDERGHWINEPVDPNDKRAVTALYLALMADAALSLIGSRDRLLIEGRFAEAEVFVRALATLRPQQRLYTSNAHNDVAFGALRLVNPDLEAPSALVPVRPLDIDLVPYATQWCALRQQQ